MFSAKDEQTSLRIDTPSGDERDGIRAADTWFYAYSCAPWRFKGGRGMDRSGVLACLGRRHPGLLEVFRQVGVSWENDFACRGQS